MCHCHSLSSPTSQFFSAGLCFAASSTVRSNQSSINSSYLNQEVDQSKSGGNFVASPLLLSIDLSILRDMLQPKFRPVCFSFLLGSHRDLPHSQSPLVLWKFSRNTHSRGILFSTRSSLFLCNNRAPIPLCGLLNCSSFLDST